MERFVANIDVRPAFDPDELTEADLDSDNLEHVAKLLHEFEETGIAPVDDSKPQQFQFDLCQECRNRLVRDPLGRDTAKHLRFSNN
jgi:hypothetical protein